MSRPNDIGWTGQQNMTIDTSTTLSILPSRGKMLGLLVLGILMTAAAAAVAFHLFPVRRGSLTEFLGGDVGTLFFALCTLLIAWRTVSAVGGAPVVTLSPDGIRDMRVAAETIPWSAVTKISIWQSQGQRVIVLAVEPAVEQQLTLTRIARWSRGANKMLGADGLCVTAQGLKTSFDTLRAATIAYAEAWRGQRSSSPARP
jgi:hypothetical protein